MKNLKGLLSATLGMFLMMGTLSAQFSIQKMQAEYVKDRIPFYLDVDFNKEILDMNTANGQVLYPVPIPAEAYKMKPRPDNILSSSGVKLVNISPNSAAHQSETWITIDPNNPDNLIATANDLRYMSHPFNMSAWYSKDGGKTWGHSLTPNANGVYITVTGSGTIFDPGIAFNSKGEAFYLYGFTQTGGDDDHGDNGLFLSKSTDGGATWLPEDVPVWMNDGQVFNDRFSMAIDYQENSPYKDYLYVSWARMSSPNQAVISSADSYDNFYNYDILWGSGGIQSPVPAVGPDGEVYCVWQHTVYDQTFRKTEAIVSKSTDGGDTWSNPRIAQSVFNCGSPNSESGRYVLADKADMRVSSVPYLDVDKSNSPRRGWVYVVQSGRDSEQGPYGLYLTYSSDGGTNWAEKIRIDENEARNDIFFPSISIDPVTGNIAILYYSSQNDPDNNQGVDAFMAVSDDGINFHHLQLTDTWYLKDNNDVVPQGPGNYYWGDYTSLVFYNGKIHPCFWMPTDEFARAYSVDLFTADLTMGINTISDLAAENVDSPSSGVNLTWKNPTTDMFNLPLSDYVLHLFKDGTKIEELAKGTTVYFDPNVIDGQVYNYEIKLVTANATSQGVAVAIQAGGSVTPANPSIIAAKPVADGIELTWKNPATTNKGTEINGTLSLVVYNGEEVLTTITENLVPGEETTKVLTGLELNSFYFLSIQSVISRGESQGESSITETLLSFAGASIDAFSEDFESELIPMYLEGPWGTTDIKAVSGDLSFTDSPDGDYDTDEDIVMITRPVTVTSKPGVLTWDFISIINKRHYLKVLATSDNGRTWEHISWTNIETSDKFQKDISESDWFHVAMDMKEYFEEGDVVFFKFVLDTPVFATPYDGYYLDNLAFGDFEVSVDDRNFKVTSLSVSPNPANDYINVSFSSLVDADANFSIVDMLGNQVTTLGTYSSLQTETSFKADISNLANGAYILKVEVDGAIQATSFVISK